MSLIPTQKDLPAPEDAKTFTELTAVIAAADEGIINLSPEQHKEIFERLQYKADALKAVFIRLDSLKNELRADRERVAEQSASIDSAVKSLKDFIVWQMKVRGWKKIKGKKYAFWIVDKKTYEPRQQPTRAHYLKFGKQYVKRCYRWKQDPNAALASLFKQPTIEVLRDLDLIETYYAWNMKAVETELRANEESELAQFFSVEVSSYPHFAINKAKNTHEEIEYDEKAGSSDATDGARIEGNGVQPLLFGGGSAKEADTISH